MFRPSIIPVLTLMSALCCGCGGQAKVSAVSVSGRVTVNGKPLPNAWVSFMPKDTSRKFAPTSSGKTDENGRFTLKVQSTGQKGAVPGDHFVSLTIAEYPEESPDGAPPVNEPIPRRFNVESKLTQTVPSDGTDSADIELKVSPEEEQAIFKR